jgi:TatD DNase family protein
MDKRLRRHAIHKHLPEMFRIVSLDIPLLSRCVSALYWLIRIALGEEATLDQAVHLVNAEGRISTMVNLNPVHQMMFRHVSDLMGIAAPAEFSLHPINSPAVLVFWRCLLVLLGRCSLERQLEFARLEVEAHPCQVFQETADTNRTEPVTHTVGQGLEVQEMVTTEETVMVDEPAGTEKELTEHSCLPAVFDSHFHLDRTCRLIWGEEQGHTVEDLLEFSVSSHVAYKPAIPVRVIGGIIVYSEPKGYPECNFTIQGPWRVAVGVHPKHYHTLNLERLLQLQRLLDNPRVAALGECGLDRTISPTEWCAQEEVFSRMLRLAKPYQPLVLHLRGPAGDVYGSDVHCHCMMLMELYCSGDQLVHVHCFTDTSMIVGLWLRKFQNVHFGITAAVRGFNDTQLAGLRAIPRDRLLLETDAPYFPFGASAFSTPSVHRRDSSVCGSPSGYASSRCITADVRQWTEAL